MADVGRWNPYVQRQRQLLPAFVDDALDPSDPAFFIDDIDDVVDSLALTPLEERYAILDPRLLLKLWLYGATQDVYSGGEVARRLRRDLRFRERAASPRNPHWLGTLGGTVGCLRDISSTQKCPSLVARPG